MKEQQQQRKQAEELSFIINTNINIISNSNTLRKKREKEHSKVNRKIESGGMRPTNCKVIKTVSMDLSSEMIFKKEKQKG